MELQVASTTFRAALYFLGCVLGLRSGGGRLPESIVTVASLFLSGVGLFLADCFFFLLNQLYVSLLVVLTRKFPAGQITNWLSTTNIDLY